MKAAGTIWISNAATECFNKRDLRSHVGNLTPAKRKPPKKKKKKKSGLNGIRIRGLCDTGAVLYQLSYQVNWELVIL